jgi:IS30 family transposase
MADHHLSLPERRTTARWIKDQRSKAEIAHILGRDRGTITRELKRAMVRSPDQHRGEERSSVYQVIIDLQGRSDVAGH